jgi:hypothetical protein
MGKGINSTLDKEQHFERIDCIILIAAFLYKIFEHKELSNRATHEIILFCYSVKIFMGLINGNIVSLIFNIILKALTKVLVNILNV